MTLVQEYESNSKKKIKKACNETGTFSVSNRKISIWFNVLNQNLFDSSLPRFDIYSITTEESDYHAACIITESGQSILEIFHIFPDKKTFLEILAHEMIHLYDYLNNDKNMKHGKSFFIWKEKIKNLGLRLNIKY
jgi:hypothetical protein